MRVTIGRQPIQVRVGSSVVVSADAAALALLDAKADAGDAFQNGVRAGFKHTNGPISVGDAAVSNRSFDPGLLVALNKTPTDNFHGVSTSYNIADMGGFAFAEFDARSIFAGNVNHRVALQDGGEKTGAGTQQDNYAVFAGLTVSGGTVLRSTGLHYGVTKSGSGSITQHFVVNGNALAEYTNPGAPSSGNTNYLLYNSGGGARISIDGQIRGKGFYAGTSEGGLVEAFTAVIDGSANAYTYYGQSGVWNWRVGMKKDETSLKILGNSTLALEVTAVSNHLLPGVDGTQNLGSGAARFGTVYASTGTINTSDAREKKNVSAIPDKWLDAWSDVEWVRFKMKGGDRWHIGLVAQQVHAAFAKHGLDAFEIGLCCFDEWDGGDRWGLRYDECQAMESAYRRRRDRK
jgi:hypothetical protein